MYKAQFHLYEPKQHCHYVDTHLNTVGSKNLAEKFIRPLFRQTYQRTFHKIDA